MPPFRSEIDELRDRDRRERKRREGRAKGRRAGRWVKEYRRLYPQLPANVIGGFLAKDLPPGSAPANRAAQLAMEQLRRENPVPAPRRVLTQEERNALSKPAPREKSPLELAAVGEGPDLTAINQAANAQRPEDPRGALFALQASQAAQRTGTAAGIAGGPALSPGGTEPSAATVGAALTLDTMRDARRRLQINRPLTWAEYERIDDLLSDSTTSTDRDRMRLSELAAGIDIKVRDRRARQHGRSYREEPYTESEQRRLQLFTEYLTDIRQGREPEPTETSQVGFVERGSRDREMLTEMRLRLSGLTPEDVVAVDGDQVTLGGSGQQKLTEFARSEANAAQEAAGYNPLGGVGEFLQPVTRTLQVGRQFPYEQLQSGVRATARSVSEIARGENPFTPEKYARANREVLEATTFGQILERVGRGEGVDLGTGFFVDPRSEIARAQAQAAREQYTINGRGATPGRLFSAGIAATGLIDPNDRAYNIISGMLDAAVAVSPLDPSNIVLGGFAKARVGAKGFLAPTIEGIQEAGTVPAVRRFLVGETADQWLHGPKGTKVLDDAWNHRDDFGYLLSVFRDTDTAVRFGDAPDLAAATRTVRRNTGLPTDEPLDGITAPRAVPRLREKPTTPFGGFLTYQARKPLTDVRLTAEMPTRPLEVQDPDAGVQTFDQLQRNGKLPYAQRDVNNREFARAVVNGDRAAIVPVVERTYEQIIDKAAKGSWGGFEALLRDPAESRYFQSFKKGMSRIFGGFEAERLYAADQMGHKAYPDFLLLDGEAKGLAHPSLDVEFLNRSIPLPDVREMRRMISWLGPIYRTPGLRQMLTGPTTFLNFVQQQFFKPAALVTRFAYPLRVVSEGQLRIAAGGYEGAFNHPLEYIAWAAGRKGTATTDNVIAQAVAEAGSAGGRHKFTEAMNRQVGLPALLHEPGGGARLAGRQLYHSSEDRSTHAWAEELSKLNASPTTRTIATIGRDAAKEEWWSGSLREVREGMMKSGGGLERLGDRAYADRYIDWVDDVRVRPFVRDDAELLDVVRSGRFRDEALLETGQVKGPRINRKILDSLEERRARGQAPEWAPGDRIEVGPQRAGAAYDRALDLVFASTIGLAEDTLNRSPHWRQAYWRNMEQVLPYAADPKVAARILRKAEKELKQYPDWLPSGLGDAQIARLRNAAANAGRGELGRTHLDTIAQARAADDVKDLLFDLSKRAQFFDVFRVVFPFGDAWREVLTRWASLVKENPKVTYRGIQALSSAQESGIFHQDANGQEVFTYFGAPWLSQFATGGVPVELAGPVEGLNIIGQGYPGVGPAVSVSARYFLPESSEWNTVREFIYPYGEPQSDDPFFSAVDQVIPAWMDKVLAASGSPLHEDLRARTTMQIVRYLYSTGEYGKLETLPDGSQVRLLSDEDIRDLMSDAKSKTTKFLLFQGAAQNILPTSPVPQWKVADRDGKLVLASEISELFYKWSEDVGQDKAIARLIDTFGPDVFVVVEGMTESLVYGLEHTERAFEWEQDHQGFVDKYPVIAGFFAPRDERDDFDIGVYQRRLDGGQLQRSDPETVVRQAQNILGEYVKGVAEASVGKDPTGEEQDYLRDVEAWLQENLAGYRSERGVTGRASTDEAIREMRRAIEDDDVRDSSVAEGVREYLAARDQVEQIAKQRFDVTQWWTANRTRGLVRYLRDMQEWVRENYEGAGQVMDQLFGRDIRSLEEE